MLTYQQLLSKKIDFREIKRTRKAQNHRNFFDTQNYSIIRRHVFEVRGIMQFLWLQLRTGKLCFLKYVCTYVTCLQ